MPTLYWRRAGGRARSSPPRRNPAFANSQSGSGNARTTAEGARRLLYEVVRTSVLQRMLCDRSPTLHARDLVAPGRIAVISGDASRVGETVARYLLAVYLALVWSELLARPSHSKTFVVLDESQWFSHESLAEMLRLARRRNVHVVLATQTVGSLPEAVADAVWTNVSDFVAFRGSPEEARELSRATHALSVEEILSLPRGHAAGSYSGRETAWTGCARPADRRRPARCPTNSTSEPTGLSRRVEERAATGEAPIVTVQNVLDWILERARATPVGESGRSPADRTEKIGQPGR